MDDLRLALLRNRAEDYLTDGKWDPEKSQQIAQRYKETYKDLEQERRKENIRQWILENKLTTIDLERFAVLVDSIPVPDKMSPRRIYKNLPNPHKTHVKTLIWPNRLVKSFNRTSHRLEKKAMFSY